MRPGSGRPALPATGTTTAALAASGRFSDPVRRIMQVGPAWRLGCTRLTRHEGGVVPLLGMRTHPAGDAAGSLSFLGAGLLH